MGYEKVTDLGTDTVVKIGGVDSKTNKPNPTRLEGYYLGSKNVKTSTGESVIQVFQTPKGNVGAWGTKELNDKLGQIAAGTMTLVEYKGKRKLQGGKTLHTYDVSQDTDNVISASAIKQVASDDSDTETTEDYEETQSSDFSEEDAEQAAALLVAEQKAKAAKVQEILNRGKQAKK